MESKSDRSCTDFALMVDQRAISDDEKLCTQRLWTTPIPLGHDLEIAPVDSHLADAIYRATTAPGENYRSSRNYGFIYAFKRYSAPRENLYTWDPDQRVGHLLALSRLVHPTSIGFRFSARVVDGEVIPRMIVPGPVYGFGSRAWVADPKQDWLAPAHADVLRALVESFWDPEFSMGKRLTKAFWSYEYAARCRELDARCPLIVTGLEALLNTNSRKATEQFLERISYLSEILQLGKISKTKADDMYSLRSKLIHGQHVDAGTNKHVRLYTEMECVLRTALRQCVLDRDFRLQFYDEATIDRYLPMP